MSWTRRWRKRLRVLVRRGAVERELEEELAFHLEMQGQRYRREGLSEAEARRRAVLEAAGIYALMSFTVTQRRREIGIRSALGALPRRVLAGVFRRSALQLGGGAGVGLAAAIGLNYLTRGDLTGGRGWITMAPVVVGIMLAVGLLAALGPARRGLRIQPMEALRAE